jgi:hypothetical protein
MQAGIALNNRYNLNTQVDKHTSVSSKGVYEVEPVDGESYLLERAGVNIYDFKGNNFSWSLPQVQASLNADIALAKHFAVFFGGSVSEIHSKVYAGFNGGFGFLFEGENAGLRFDLGVDYYETSYDAQVVKYEDVELKGNDTRNVYLGNVSKKEKYTNLNFAVCFNTKNRDWLLNYFLNYAYGNYTFYDFNNTEDVKTGIFYSDDPNKGVNSIPVSQYALGAYKNINENIRAIAGFGVTKYHDHKKNLVIFDSFVQFDFMLF